MTGFLIARDRRRAQVAAMTAAGKSAAQIAAATGRHKRTIVRDRAHLGIAGKTAPPLSDYQITEGNRLEAAGVYPTEIARTIGCSTGVAVERWPANKLSRSEARTMGQLRTAAIKAGLV